MKSMKYFFQTSGQITIQILFYRDTLKRIETAIKDERKETKIIEDFKRLLYDESIFKALMEFFTHSIPLHPKGLFSVHVTFIVNLEPQSQPQTITDPFGLSAK